MGGERNIPASSRKLRKAREGGDVARSREFTAAIVLTSGALMVFWGFSLTETLLELIQSILVMIKAPTPDNMLLSLKRSVVVGASAILPILGAVWLVAAIAEVCQAGLFFSMEAITFRLSRLELGQGLQRVFGLDGARTGCAGRIAYDLCKPVVAVIMVGGSALYVVVAERWRLLGAGDALPPCLMNLREISQRWIAGLCGVFLLVGAVDLLWVRFMRQMRLKMDREELRQEFRESEGSAEVRGFRRQLHQEILARDMIQGVRRARAVVVGRRSSGVPEQS